MQNYNIYLGWLAGLSRARGVVSKFIETNYVIENILLSNNVYILCVFTFRFLPCERAVIGLCDRILTRVSSCERCVQKS
jgi:hypothetical protein